MKEVKTSKYGRKRKPQEELQNHYIKVWMNRLDKQKLVQISTQYGKKNTSHLCHDLLLNGYEKITIIPEINRIYVEEINKIGVNLNQIARNVNANQADIKQIHVSFEELKELLMTIKKLLTITQK